MAKVDKTMTAMVQEVLRNREGKAYGFKVAMNDGIIQKFTLGQRSEGCPSQGTVVRIQYNVSPGNEEYPDPTYWCNAWTNTNGGSPHEVQAERIEQQEADYEPVERTQAQPPVRRFETNDSISMAVCIRWVTEAQLGNLAAAVSQPDVDAMSMTISPVSIAREAEALYQRVFVYGPDEPEHPSG